MSKEEYMECHNVNWIFFLIHNVSELSEAKRFYFKEERLSAEVEERAVESQAREDFLRQPTFKKHKTKPCDISPSWYYEKLMVKGA